MQEKNEGKEILNKFSRNLRKFRNGNKYTQLYVSINTGIDISLYQKYESNNCPNIKLLNLVKLSKFYKKPIDDFLK